MIKNVKNNARPIKLWLGGDVCVPIADRTKCRTMIILVKEVNMISMDGAKARIVMTSKIRTFADKDPESESRVNDTPPLPVTQSLEFGALSVAP